MRNIFMIAKNNFDKTKFVITMFLLIFSVLIVCQNSAFIFNPFILVLLCTSYVISFFTLLIVGGTSSIVGFIINKSYGIEILCIVIMFLLFYYVSYFFKNKKIRQYLPMILSNVCLFLIYLFTSSNVFDAINSIVLVFLSVSFSFNIINFIGAKCNDERANYLSVSVLLVCLISVFMKVDNVIYILLSSILLIIFKMNKRKIYLTTCFISFFVFYLFSELSINVLMSIYLSFFLLEFLEFKYSYFFFVPILSLFMFSINETFYFDQIYIQMIIGFILANIIPNSLIDKVDKFLFDDTNNTIKKLVEYQNNKLNDISKLCDLLMDDRFDKFEGLDKVLEKVIKKDVCSKCNNKEACVLHISKYLSGYLSNNEKQEITKVCIYPYQLTKSINTANKRIIDYSEREVKSIESKKIMNNAYQIIRKYIDLKPIAKVNKKNYYLDFAVLSKEADSSPNGDSYRIYNDDINSKLMLSDGMGHTSKSKDISEYVIELINYLYLISDNTSNSIESCNQIILAKTYEEVYATLDICDFDLEKGVASIYKIGSFPCYLIRNRRVIEISTKLPPIGIISNIKVQEEKIELQHNDILLFLTDGFGEGAKEIIESTSQKSSFLPLKNYVKFLFKKLQENISIDDDRTIVGVKIMKI